MQGEADETEDGGGREAESRTEVQLGDKVVGEAEGTVGEEMGVMAAAEQTAPDLSSGKVPSSREEWLLRK